MSQISSSPCPELPAALPDTVVFLVGRKHSFRRSAIAGGTGASLDSGLRTSQSAYVSASGDAIVRCIEDRAIGLQGYDVTRSQLEPLQLVRYLGARRRALRPAHGLVHGPALLFRSQWWQRLSSFFAYVAVSNDTTRRRHQLPFAGHPEGLPVVRTTASWTATSLTTQRPDLPPRRGKRHLLGKPSTRAASVTPGPLHAGLPLASGTKVGLNIWTRQAPLSDEARGADDEMYPEL